MRKIHTYRQAISLLFCLVALLLLAGCPYESSVPLGPATDAKIDGSLLGRWKYEDKKSKATGFLTMSRFNNSELLIVVEEEGKKVPDMMRAFATNVGGENFLNVQEIKGPYGDRAWMFVKYRTGDCSLTYGVVNDSLVPGGGDKSKRLTSGRLSDLIKKNLGNKKVFDEETTLTCVKTEGTK
ncbi:MAG: hypothetical protein M0Z60_08400 [Nitrospiraceae bacterium]|nr:hypothetical protein [Nitrospiraceae bacterium]